MNTTFESWELQTRLALARQEITFHVADPLIEDAKAHWETSGQTPWEALGSPQDFAAAAAAEQPPDAKAGRDREGGTPISYLTGAGFVLPVMLVPWSLVAAVVYGSFSVALTPARLVGSVLFALAFLTLFGVPDALRAAGRPRLAPWAYLPTLLLMALSTIAFTVLPHQQWIRIPVLVLDAVAIVVILIQLGPAKPDRPLPEREPARTAEQIERWFADLEGLLIGRHDLPPTRAAELVAEARSHLAAAPDPSPSVEFGLVEIYAAEIAGPETVRTVPWWHQQATRNIVFVAFCAVLNRSKIGSWIEEEQIWTVLAIVVITVGALAFGILKAAAGQTQRSSAQEAQG